jgi:dTDP-glucose 4,6-dehydratase
VSDHSTPNRASHTDPLAPSATAAIALYREALPRIERGLALDPDDLDGRRLALKCRLGLAVAGLTPATARAKAAGLRDLLRFAEALARKDRHNRILQADVAAVEMGLAGAHDLGAGTGPDAAPALTEAVRLQRSAVRRLEAVEQELRTLAEKIKHAPPALTRGPPPRYLARSHGAGTARPRHGDSMTTILVTGGCGFIGSNFVRYALGADPDVRVVNLDALTYAGNPDNLADLAEGPRYRFVKADVTDRAAVAAALEGVEAVVHFAAESHVDRSILDSGPFVRTNVLGTQVLLDAARARGVQRFLNVSTDEVYGSLGPTGAFTEETPLAPNSPYAASKAAADLLVRAYAHTFGMPCLITRCSNNYGPYQFPEKLIPLFISNLSRDEQVPVYGDGMQVRDWLHVRDHCAAIWTVWRQGRVGEVYNVGGRCEKTNLELTHALLAALGKPASLIKYVKDRPGHDRRYAIDCSKIERELGWRPTVTFEDGLRDTIRWYRDNAAWVERVRSGEYLKYYQRQYGDR